MTIPTTTIYTAPDSAAAQEYVIALVDVLGFSDRVQASSLPLLIAEYQQLLKTVGWSATIPVYHLAAGTKTDWVVRAVVFSDTVLAWSHIDQDRIEMLLSSCARLMAEAAKIGWPLRGIVTVGECVIHEQQGLFIGQGIVRAVQGEKAQNWLGFGIDEAALAHPVAGPLIEGHVDFMRYTVPVKPGAIAVPAALKWKLYDPWAPDAVAKMKQAAPASEVLKYQAALDFLAAH